MAEVEQSIDAAEGLRALPGCAVEPLCTSRKGWTTKVGDMGIKLETHEQIYLEVGVALEREERKLNEKQKRVGVASSSQKKLFKIPSS